MQHIVKDMVNHPSYYADNCSIECIDVIELVLGGDGTIKYCLGNAIKYVWRCKFKNGIEDLEKARWYLNRLLTSYIEDDLVCYEDKINYLIRIINDLENDIHKE